MKMPFVKAKVGPRIMTLIADPKVYEILPVKKEVKAVVSGIYITEIKSVRGGAIPAPPKKKGFFARFKSSKQKAVYRIDTWLFILLSSDQFCCGRI